MKIKGIHFFFVIISTFVISNTTLAGGAVDECKTVYFSKTNEDLSKQERIVFNYQNLIKMSIPNNLTTLSSIGESSIFENKKTGEIIILDTLYGSDFQLSKTSSVIDIFSSLFNCRRNDELQISSEQKKVLQGFMGVFREGETGLLFSENNGIYMIISRKKDRDSMLVFNSAQNKFFVRVDLINMNLNLIRQIQASIIGL